MESGVSPMEVAAGLIFNNNREVLIAKRLEPERLAGLWEFPGGKIEEEESPQECLKREIKEEFGLEIELHEKIITTQHKYDFGEFEFHVFQARRKNGKVEAKEHGGIEWIKKEEIENYNLAPADRKIIEKIKGDMEDFEK